jgi:hypothetical protein
MVQQAGDGPLTGLQSSSDSAEEGTTATVEEVMIMRRIEVNLTAEFRLPVVARIAGLMISSSGFSV